MKNKVAAIVVGVAAFCFYAPAETKNPPKAGPVEILKSSELKPGMQAVAWTVFEGTKAEAVPIEIIGLWKNAWGPRQDIILGKMGGKAERTNVAGGMSGSPVYIDGKLIGAVALRLSVFSPDAICGITPIELMLEINDIDKSRPQDAVTPEGRPTRASLEVPDSLVQRVAAASASGEWMQNTPLMTPIETPLVFSGFNESTLREFGPFFKQMGVQAVQGGASGATYSTKPAKDWQSALQPGEPISGVLVSGDMSVAGLGTVTYNDGKRVLGFGHPFFNLGPVDMPMAKGEVLMVLASKFAPNKIANTTEIVGALRQDRHSGIMGELGSEVPMIPVSVKVRTFGDTNSVLSEKDFTFNVFIQQKWTPFLMMVTLFNSVSGLNEFRDEATYRLNGTIEMDGGRPLSLSTMLASSELPMPAPMQLAGWWADKFNRLFSNQVETPKLKSVNVSVDLLPERRTAGIEYAWVGTSEARPGDEVPIKVFLRPYRGERIEKNIKVKIPLNLTPGSHKILLSDASTLNRLQAYAGALNRYLDLPQTISLINQERSNNQLYVSLVESAPTAYFEDKTLPSLPSSVLNVMQTARASTRSVITVPETAMEQASIPFDYVVNGSYTLKINIK